jgi:hypothetical protein
LVSDEVFALNVVIFTQKLQEFEGSAIGPNAGLRIDFFVCGFRLKDVFTMHISLGKLIEIVIIDGGN